MQNMESVQRKPNGDLATMYPKIGLPANQESSLKYLQYSNFLQSISTTKNIYRSYTSYAPNESITQHKIVRVAALLPVAKRIDTGKAKYDETNDNSKLNMHFIKIRENFAKMFNTANKKLLELRRELDNMQRMSNEFGILAEKLTVFEDNINRMQKSVWITEDRINEINSSNHRMAKMIQQINHCNKQHHVINREVIYTASARLTRLEVKLGRIARKIAQNKIDGDGMKSNDGKNYNQLKQDIEAIFNDKMHEVSTKMEIKQTQNVIMNMIFCILILIIIEGMNLSAICKKTYQQFLNCMLKLKLFIN